MAGVDTLYVDRSEKTTYFNEEPGINTCLKCIYLEEYLQVVLFELSSMKLAVKFLYANSNTVGPVSEVRPHLLPPVHGEVSSPTMWQTAKPKYYNMSNRVGGTEVLQFTEPVLTSNRYDVLSNCGNIPHTITLFCRSTDNTHS
jgi:hypothetical protein